MAKKQYFLIVDTETTMEQHVFDFAGVVVDRKGNVEKSCAVIVNDYKNEQLFHDAKAKEKIWTIEGLKRRQDTYRNMLESGSRMLASTNAINRWLERVRGKYNPELTAYNLAFDLDKCFKSNIDLSIFSRSFCLWYLASTKYANTKKYLDFVCSNHYFNAPTSLGNMTYKTNAEVMARFVTGTMLDDEPHTALEDILYYELPILKKIVTTKNWRSKVNSYDWNKFQVKDHFTGKANKNVDGQDSLC